MRSPTASATGIVLGLLFNLPFGVEGAVELTARVSDLVLKVCDLLAIASLDRRGNLLFQIDKLRLQLLLIGADNRTGGPLKLGSLLLHKAKSLVEHPVLFISPATLFVLLTS